MKKKILITFGAALSLLALASCGSNTDNGKLLEGTVVKDVFGKTVDNRSFKSISTPEGGAYGYLGSGYYYTAAPQGNIIVKSFDDEAYSVDLGVKASDVVRKENHGSVVEIVTKSGDNYKHTFYSYKGEKITEKTTDFSQTFNQNISSYNENTDYLTEIEYYKFDYEHGSGTDLTKVTIYCKETTDKNYNSTHEFALTPFASTEVIKDAVKVGDYYAKEFIDNNTRIAEFYDSENKLDDRLVLEDGNQFNGVFVIDDKISVYQRSKIVSKNSDYDYYYGGIYYKLESVMIDAEKHKMKELDLNYVVGTQISDYDGEYAAITYRNIIDRKLEYTSIGFVNDSFDIKYSLPNESTLMKVKGGYYSSANYRLYNENFEVVKEIKGSTSVNVSIDKSYLVVNYSDYRVILDTATGNVLAEGKKTELAYEYNLIVKKNGTTQTAYDVVNGALVQRMSSTESATKYLDSDSNYYYMLTTYGTDTDTVQIYAYGSNTPLTAYVTHGDYYYMSLTYNTDDMLYFAAYNLYTDSAKTKELKLCKVESYSKKPNYS